MLRWLWAVKLKIKATLACAVFSAGAGLRLTNKYRNQLFFYSIQVSLATSFLIFIL
jgi:hypothetical protein